MKKIVIIGGCAAGPKVAAKSRRMDKDAEINLYTSSKHISYSACGLPYFIGDKVKNINNLLIRLPEDFEKENIHIHTKKTCEKILPEEKAVIVDGERVEYDELVLATGARAYMPNIKNSNLKNIFTLRFIEDGINIKRIAQVSKSVLMVGFGYIALEMLEAFLRNNLKIYVVENGKYPMSAFDIELREKLYKYITENEGKNVEFISQDTVVEFIGDDCFKGAITKRGKEIRADFCFVSTGVRPNVEIAKQAGIEIGKTGAIKTNNRMQTNIEHIWAAGDCIQKNCIITKLPVHITQGSIANKEGRVCAINLNGGDEVFDGILCSTATKFFDFTMSLTGITEKRAKSIKNIVGIEPVSVIVNKLDKASYMPDAKPITIKLIADKKSGKLLGAQGCGLGDADKRINVVTSALQKGMTVDEFLHLDLTYTPTTSGTIDPLLTASYELKKLIDE